MNNEEKILEVLSKMQTQMGQMQTQMDQMESKMGQMLSRQDKMESQMGTMQVQMKQILARQDQMETQVDQMRKQLDRAETRQDRAEVRLDRIDARQEKQKDDIQWIKVYLELDVEKRLEAINEGIDIIQEKLIPEERVEKSEEDIIVLKTAVRALALDAAEMKKAE